MIALASIAAGAINAGAAATVGADSTQNLIFFTVVAAAQLLWGAVLMVRASRWWLFLGALGNAVVVATWVVSRTVALPFGEYSGVILPVKFPDTLATVLEAVVALGALVLAVRGRVLTRPVTRSLAGTLGTTVVIGLLGLFGVLVQTGAIASNPTGTSNQGPSPTVPAPGGGGGGSNPYGGGGNGGSGGGGGSTPYGGGGGAYSP